jgi:hypothetical protein
MEFNDLELRGRYQRFRTIHSHNTFPWRNYFTWVFANTICTIVLVVPAAINQGSKDTIVLISCLICIIGMASNYLILFLRSSHGLRFLGSYFRIVVDSLEWRNKIEELLCVFRIFSAGQLLAVRCYRGRCPEGSGMPEQVMCNTMAELRLLPLDCCAALFLNFFLERFWFASIRVSVSIVSWLTLSISIIVSFVFTYIPSNNDKVSSAVWLPINCFVVISSVALLMCSYNQEKIELEKYLLATKSDGGETVRNLVQSGESVSESSRFCGNSNDLPSRRINVNVSGLTTDVMKGRRGVERDNTSETSDGVSVLLELERL